MKHQTKVALVSVVTPQISKELIEARRIETKNLIETFGGQVSLELSQNRHHPHPNTYLGSGKVKELVNKVIAQKIDVIVVNDQLSAGQLFRLEKAFWESEHRPEVWDRIDVILNIFDLHANTTIAKLQIELARLKHLGPRMVGLGKDVLSRQGGGIGTRGLGETNLEREKRLQHDRIKKIEQQLAKIDRQTKNRLQHRQKQGLGPVALVGYTSAGKTTLFNQLTGKAKPESHQLFTTLDTVVGKLKSSELNVPILISDTIGFISDLPPNLIDAFKSTLIESLEAKIVLHVIDVSDPSYLHKINVVNQILSQLNITSPVWMVFNQIDQLKQAQLEALRQQHNSDVVPSFFISAKTGIGVDKLKHRLFEGFSRKN